ncbi:phage major capsid protein [Oryzobacter terrae]|uniref:phage major capsid protein n=1 Tax=Oryzobacter terrae TaxID=1620385 RepID=UPI00366FD293
MPLVTTADLRSEDFYRQLVIPALNEASVVLRSIRRIDTTATKVNLPIVNDANVGWVAEGAPLPDAGVSPDLVQVVPRKLAAYADITNESVGDANAAEIVGQAMAQALARKVDAAFFTTGGLSAPPALDTAAVLEVDADPTTGIDPYIDSMAQMEAAGSTPTVIFANPLDWAALAKVKESTGSNRPVLVASSGPTLASSRSLNGLPVEISSGVPQGAAYVVDGTRTAVVVRQDGSVEADRSIGFRNDITVVRVVGRFAFGFLYASATARIREEP